MVIEQQITGSVIAGIKELYGADVAEAQVQLQKTKKEFKGHLTLVVFPFLRMSKKSPEQTAQELGEYLVKNEPAVAEFNVIKGFLNLTVASGCWIDLLNEINAAPEYGFTKATENSPLVMIEYSSPNTNKPLHLGHVRNNLLGYSLSKIMEANGNKVVKTNIVNDRGIHICKSMLAWQKWGNGITPEKAGKKGDHLIGDFYVLFSNKLKEETAALEAKGMTKEEAEKMAREKGWNVAEDAGRGWRQVVASPKPMAVVELTTIRALADAGMVVIACGGGGIPVIAVERHHLKGAAAVIDKDFASELLAEQLNADMLIILAAGEGVAVTVNKPDLKWLDARTPEEARAYMAEGQFAPGSMLPKVEAAVKFAESKPGRAALITLLEKARDGIDGKTGTLVSTQ